MLGDSGRTSDRWEWDNDAMYNWWDQYNPVNDPNSVINQTIEAWADAFQTGNVGTATGGTVSDGPEILGNAFDVAWRWLIDEVATEFGDSYDFWDVYPEGQMPSGLGDPSNPPAIGDPVNQRMSDYDFQ